MVFLEIVISPACKHAPVGYTCFFLFTRFEFYPAFKVDIPAEKNPLIDIVIERFYRDSQFRMVRDDHVRRLSLRYERGNGFIEVFKLFFGKIHPLSGRYEKFFVMALGCFGIVIIFGLYGTHMPGFTAAIADVRSLFCLPAVFAFKTAADVVAAVAGTAEGVTDDQLVTGIRFPSSVSVDTEVVGIIKTSAAACVNNAVFPNLFGDG